MQEQKIQILDIIGLGHSGLHDISEKHNKYLTDKE